MPHISLTAITLALLVHPLVWIAILFATGILE